MVDEAARIDFGAGPEMNLLQACMCARAGVISPSEAVEHACRVDGDPLTRLAMQHRLIPVVFHVFEQAAEQVPEEVFTRVREACLQTAAKSALWMSELERIHRRLTSENIPAIAMRGPILSWRLYQELWMRQFSDLDLLISAKDAQRATALLVDDGYEAQFHLDKAQQRAYVHCRTERFFIKSEQRLCVDVHWQLLPRCFTCHGDEAALWERAEELQVEGYDYPVLAEEDLVLFMCAHGAKHGWDQLALVLDLGCALRGKSSDPLRAWHAAAQNLGKGRVVELGYALVRDVIGLPIAAELCGGEAVSKLVSQVKRGYAGGVQGGNRGGREKGIVLGVLERPIDRLRYISELVFVPSGIELGWVSLPRPLYFVYYVLRVLRLVVKHTVGRIVA